MQRVFEENQEGSLCTITEDSLLGGIQFFCKKQIPNKLVQAVTGHSLAEEMKKTPPSVTKECKRVGSASKNRMAFTEDPVCQDALLYAMDMDASFQKNECLMTKEEDLLSLSCQIELPLLLTPFTSKIATDKAYLFGIIDVCQEEGPLEKDKVRFSENLLCIDRLKDALRNQWSPLVKAQCELVLDPLQSDLQVTLSCRKGIPQNILSALMESANENK